jgi:hypothetical protein
MAVDPIGEWPGELTRNRARSNFASSLSSTMDTLRRELTMLGARNARMQIAIAPEAFRLDGYPRATAKPEHPGIILTLDSKHGPLSYPCDTFLTWQDNLRAIALALEALRKVDRYGVTRRGEQYRGFLAIEATAMPAGFGSVDEAWTFILDRGGYDRDETRVSGRIRDAKRSTHPDLGGRAEDFQRVTAAEQYLKQNGAIA